jgi:carbonic anhydrase
MADGPLKNSPDEALRALVEGNRRYADGKARHPHLSPERCALAARADQADYALATVVACSDSRVPVELIFDAGLMDLFVVRVAGNVATPGVVGSVEYGVAHVRTPLLVVLGHTGCGAVTAALQAEAGGAPPAEPHMRPLLDAIGPAVRSALARDGHAAAALPHAVAANARHALGALLRNSPVVRTRVGQGRLAARAAVYELETGRVRWLDGGPA